METPKKTLLILQPVEKIEDVSEKAVRITYSGTECIIPSSQIFAETPSAILGRSFKKTFGTEIPTGVLIPKWIIEKKVEEAATHGKTPFKWVKTYGAWLIDGEITWIPPRPKSTK
jgi:hypothetical protein